MQSPEWTSDAALLTRADHDLNDLEELAGLVDRRGLDEIHGWASAHDVASIAGTVLLERGLIPADHPWTAAIDQRRRASDNAFRWLETAVAALEAAGVSAAVVESAGVVLAAGVEPTRFCSSDIDLLIGRGQADLTHAVLLDQGCEHLRALPRVDRRVYSIPESAGAGAVRSLEVTWSPFCRTWTSIDQGSIDWLELAEPDPRYPSLSRLPPSVAFVFQAVHASLHYYRLRPGLRLHAENQWLLAHRDFDGSTMAAVARAGRFRRRTACALQCVEDVYGPTDPGILDALTRESGLGLRGARALLWATRHRGGAALRGVLEPMLDDRGSLRWIRDLVGFWGGAAVRQGARR